MTRITDDSIYVDEEGFIYSQNPWVEFIKRRILQYNKNFMGLVLGGTGSGKSFSTIRLARLIDKDFNLNKIVFTTSEFLALLNSGTLKKGDVIIFDDAGTGISKKLWYSLKNILFNFVMQTYRFYNLAVFFTVPDASFIDSDTKKLFHAIFVTEGINEIEKKTILKPKIICKHPDSQKIYYKFLRVIYKDRTDVISHIKVKLANEKFLEDYEEKKQNHMQNMNKMIEEELKVLEYYGQKNKNFSLEDDEKQAYNLYLKGYSLLQIAQVMNKPINEVKKILRKVIKKGFKIETE